MIRNQWTRHAVSLQEQKASCRNREKRSRLIRQAAPAERSWRGVLRGHVPSKSLSADSEIPVPMLLGTRRRWVRKAIAFRGRSEQDRSALCSVCCIMILETFRWNVSNASFLLKPINAVQICCSHSKQVIHKPQSPSSAQTRGCFYSRTAAGASGRASPFGTQQEITHCP